MKFNGKTMSAQMQINYAGAVSYTPQELSESEQLQARKNIGAFAAADADKLRIVPTAHGTAAEIHDAAAMPVQGLRIFGRSMLIDGHFEAASMSGIYVQQLDIEHGDGSPIIRHPANATAKVGDSVQFSVLCVQPEENEYSYCWQYRQKNPGQYYDCSDTFDGNKSACITIPVTEVRNGFEYRCKVTVNGVTYASNSAFLIVADEAETASMPNYGRHTYNGAPHWNVVCPYPMHGIRVESGGNYVDENGQHWLTDEIDGNANVHIQRLDFIEGYQGDPSQEEFTFYELSAAGDLLFELPTPVITQLSDTPIDLSAMILQKPNTTVFPDAPFFVELQYVADPKAYIDNKFEELRSAIIAQGANV